MKKIVDIGCGKNKAEDAIGLDMDPGSDADCIQDAYALPFVDKSFDLAISNFNIEHLENPGIAVKEMMRVAQRCQITTDDASHWRLHSIVRHADMEESCSGHVMIFQPEHLKTLIRRMGGVVDDVILKRSTKTLDRFHG
ncbi:MAG: class I SAM-dependent methyltransferase [Candidatus Ranarchaeia archaeon]